MKFNIKTTLVAIITIQAACTAPISETKSENKESDLITLSQEEKKLAGIHETSAQWKDISHRVSTRGLVNIPPQNSYSVHIPYGGFVKIGEMLPGTPIKKGMVLFYVQNPIFIKMQQAYLEAKIKQEQLDLSYKRQSTLVDEKIHAAKTLESLRAERDMNLVLLQSLKSQLEIIGVDIKRLNPNDIRAELPVFAPESGYIETVKAANGAYVSDKDVVLTMNRFDDLHIELDVFEKDLMYVKEGQQIQFKLVQDGIETPARNAHVFLISTNITSGGTAKIHGHLNSKYTDLRPGMFLNSEILCNPRKVLQLPSSSVVNFQQKNYAFYTLTDSNTSKIEYRIKELKLGTTNDNWVEIIPEEVDFDYEHAQWVDQGARLLLSRLKNVSDE